MDTQLLTRLVTAPGISGYEQRIRDVVRAELEGVVDEVRTDGLGNLLGIRRGSGPRVMLSAHMDTIGFLVSHVDDDGFIRISPVGGFDPRTLVNQRVLVQGRRDLVGLVGMATKPVHLTTPQEREKAPKLEDLFVDVMLPAEEAKQNVSVGDPVTLLREPVETDRAYSSPYQDDRVGVYVLLEALRGARDLRAEVCAVVSVQEEVGLRGARVSAFGVEPDLGIALDVSPAADTPGGENRQQHAVLGKGVAIGLMDSSHIADPRLVARLKERAERNSIQYQLQLTNRGGTDAGGIQLSRAGVPVVTLCVPTRYIHTSNELVVKSDVDEAVALLARFLESAHELSLGW